MKNSESSTSPRFLFSLLLTLMVTSAHGESKSKGALSSLKDPAHPSGSMSEEDLAKDPWYEKLRKGMKNTPNYTLEEEMKMYKEAESELFDETAVVFYKESILSGMKGSKDTHKYIQEIFDGNARALANCMLVSDVRASSIKNTSYENKSAYFGGHLTYFIRAYGGVINQPNLEKNVAKQLQNSYSVKLKALKQSFSGNSEEAKKHYALAVNNCDKVLERIYQTNRSINNKISRDAIKVLAQKKLQALAGVRK